VLTSFLIRLCNVYSYSSCFVYNFIPVCLLQAGYLRPYASVKVGIINQQLFTGCLQVYSSELIKTWQQLGNMLGCGEMGRLNENPTSPQPAWVEIVSTRKFLRGLIGDQRPKK